MAGTATISSTFVIQFTPSDTAATTITNPGRGFKIVGISANNTTGGALNLTVTDGSGNISKGGAFACAANTTTWIEVVDAACDITPAENLVVTCSGTGLSPIQILCVAVDGGASLTAT